MKRMLLCWNAYWNKYLILLQIMNLYFWKSLLGPIMSFIVVPLLSLGFLLINSDYVNTIMPSVISNPLIFLPFWFLISAIYDLKKNSIVEKIFIFSKKPIHSNIIVTLFLFIIIIMSFLWNLFVVFLISLNKDTFKYNLFSSIDWGAVVFIVLLSLFLSISISSMIYTFIKSPIKGQLVSYILSVFFMIFSGSVAPMASTTSSVITYISYFSPFKYISSSFVVAMNSGFSPNNLDNVSIFDLSKNFIISSAKVEGNQIILESKFILFHSYDLCLNIFVPLILSIVFLSLSLNTRICRKK